MSPGRRDCNFECIHFKHNLRINVLRGLLWVQSFSFKPLAPGICGNNFTSAFFELILQIPNSSTSSEIGLSWVPENPINDKSTFGSSDGLEPPQDIIAWTNVDPELCCHITSLSQNEFTRSSQRLHYCHWRLSKWVIKILSHDKALGWTAFYYWCSIKSYRLGPDFINPQHVEFISWNEKIYLHFLSFLDTQVAQVMITIPFPKGDKNMFIKNTQYHGWWWPGKAWPWHQQPWYWPSYTKIFWFQCQSQVLYHTLLNPLLLCQAGYYEGHVLEGCGPHPIPP